MRLIANKIDMKFRVITERKSWFKRDSPLSGSIPVLLKETTT